MSTPAQITEKHKELVSDIRLNMTLPKAWQAVADSEARAVAEAERRMDEEEFKPCSALCDQLRAEVERLNASVAEMHTHYGQANARAETAEANAERYRRVTLRQDSELAAEREKVRVLREALTKAARETSRLVQTLPITGPLPCPSVMQECAYALDATESAIVRPGDYPEHEPRLWFPLDIALAPEETACAPGAPLAKP